MTIAQILAAAVARGLERLDAQLLLLHALGRDANDRAWLLAHDQDLATPEVLQRFEDHSVRRLAGEPVAYLLGEKEFFGLPLQVDARVLVPRPDTETLVEWALEHLPAGGSVIDLGTGSGAIALALAHARPDALAVASANAQRLGLRVRFQQADWLQGVDGPYDLVVSNPPYIADADPHLAALVHEPLSALAAGADGLDDLRTVVADAPAHLAAGGWLLLEHGHDQAEAVCALLRARGFAQVGSRTDLAGIARCSGGQWPITG